MDIKTLGENLREIVARDSAKSGAHVLDSDRCDAIGHDYIEEEYVVHRASKPSTDTVKLTCSRCGNSYRRSLTAREIAQYSELCGENWGF